MQNKPTYRLFEDKVDKLVHDKLIDETIYTTQHEWQSLQQRLQDYNKKPVQNLYKYISIISLFTAVIFALFFFTNTSKTKSVSVPINNDNSKDIAIYNNNQPLTNVDKNTSIPSINNVLKENDQKAKINLSNNKPDLNQNKIYINTIKINTLKDKLIISPSNTEKKRVISIIKEAENKSNYNKEDNSTSYNQHEQSAVPKITPLPVEEKENEIVQATNNTTTPLIIPTAQSINEVAHWQGIHNDPKSIIPTVAKTKQQKYRKEAPQHDFTNDIKWYVEAYSGITNSVKDKNSFAIFLAPTGLIDKRLNQESAITTANAGVNFKLSKNHFLLSSGLSYLQFGDRVNYDSSLSGSFGLKANGKSSFTYIEVPVLAGYDWAYKRWGFNLQGGLSMGLLVNTSGQYLSTNSIVVPQTVSYEIFDLKKNQATFKKSVFNVIINPQLNYFINSNTNIFISPIYRRNLQPITIAYAEIKQKYNSFGINFGLRTRLK
jgi:hypothetical protein